MIKNQVASIVKGSCLILLVLYSCQKESANTNGPVSDDTGYVLDSIVTQGKPSSTCVGCTYSVRGVTKFFYNAEGKVWKTQSIEAKSNNSVWYDTITLELANGNGYRTRNAIIIGSPEQPINLGREDLGLLTSFNTVQSKVNVSKVYKNILPSEAGAVDTLEMGISDAAFDAFGRLSRFGYHYYQTILTKQVYPLERKVIAFPYKLSLENDKDGLIRSLNTMTIIDDDQRKNSAGVSWAYLNIFYKEVNNTRYYSPYYYRYEEEVVRTGFKILNAPYLFYTELPETYLRLKTTTKSSISKDSVQGWTLFSTKVRENIEVQTENEYVKTYKVRNELQEIISIVTYYFHKK